MCGSGAGQDFDDQPLRLLTGHRETWSHADSPVVASRQIRRGVLLSLDSDLPGPERFGTVLPLQQASLTRAVNDVTNFQSIGGQKSIDPTRASAAACLS